MAESGTGKLETKGGEEGSQRRQSADLRHFATRLFTDRVWPLQLFSTRWRNVRLRKSVKREMDVTEGTPQEEGTVPSADQQSG